MKNKTIEQSIDLSDDESRVIAIDYKLLFEVKIKFFIFKEIILNPLSNQFIRYLIKFHSKDKIIILMPKKYNNIFEELFSFLFKSFEYYIYNIQYEKSKTYKNVLYLLNPIVYYSSKHSIFNYKKTVVVDKNFDFSVL